MKNNMLLSRVRVNNELNKILEYPLSIINGPMGCGKTTAVKDFLDTLSVDYIWFSSSSIFQSEEYFWAKLTDQISSIDPDVAQMLKVLGFPLDSIQITRILEVMSLITEKSELTIIIDDYQYIENPEKNEFITSFAKAQIPNLHMVIIARSIPRLPLVEMIAKDIVYMPDHLLFMFNKKEIREYFKLMNVKINEKTLEDVFLQTGGWITAIYLYKLSITNESNFNFDYSLDQLLNSSIFQHYDTSTQIMLCKLSIFNSFSIEQAAFVLDEDSVSVTIHQLYNENAFIMQDGIETFRFHRIFWDFLRKKRADFDIDFHTLYLRAGKWYADINDYAMSFQYLKKAKDYNTILTKLESPDFGRQAYELDQKLLYEIFEEIAEIDYRLIYKFPMAALKYAFLLMTNSEEKKGIALLDDLKNYFSSNQHSKYTQNRIMAEISLVSTYTVFNDIEKMVEHHKSAYELLNGEHSLIRSREDILSFGIPHFTYTYYKTKGEYQKIVKVLSNQMVYYMQLTGGCGMGCDFLSQAEYALETGDMNNAEINAFKAIYKAKMYNQFDILIGAKFTLARIYTFQGKYEAGLELLDDLSLEIGNLKDTILHNTIDLSFGYLHCCQGEFAKIPSWIHNNHMPVTRFKHQGTSFDCIVYGKAKLLTENYLELELLTESFNERFHTFDNQLGFIHNHIHNAVAKYHLYGIQDAVIELSKAFEIAKADRIVMPFAENAIHILPIIKSGLIHLPNEYLAKVQSMCTQYASIMPSSTASAILSKREIEILTYLAAGKSQKNIAEKLFISPNTVKRHIQNIYLKLDVDNKTMAIKKAREINIKLD